MFVDGRDRDLSPLPVVHVPGLDEDVVAVHPVVELLRLAPLHVERAVTRAGQVGDQRPERFFHN